MLNHFILILAITLFASNSFAYENISELKNEIQSELGIVPTDSIWNSFHPKSVAIDPASGYTLKLIGSRYGLVYTPLGEPLVLFDLSLSHLKTSEILLGGIGFGDLTLNRLISLVFKSRKAARNSSDTNATSDIIETSDTSTDLNPQLLEKNNVSYEKAMSLGKDFFKDLRFKKEWAERNGIAVTAENLGHGQKGITFAPASFTMDDIEYPSTTAKLKLTEPFVLLAQIVDPQTVWTPDNIGLFTKQIEFRYNANKPGYDLFWNRTLYSNETDKKKLPALPEVLVNYFVPYAPIITKVQLYKLTQYGEAFIRYFGIYGILEDFVVSRICWNLVERLDYHENQLRSVLEAQTRFETTTAMPTNLIDGTIDLLYMNKFYGAAGSHVIDGLYKRKQERSRIEAARVKTLKRLERISLRKKMELEEFSGGKFAVARSQSSEDTGAFKGVYGLETKPFLGIPSMHVHPKTTVFKIIERNIEDLMGFLSRVFIPNNIGIVLFKFVYIGTRLEPYQKDNFIRSRMIKETNAEGELLGLINESLEGRYDALPLNKQEMEYSKKHLFKTYINPYKTPIDQQATEIEFNLKNLQYQLNNGGI